MLAELAVIQATSSLAMARISAQRLLALGALAMRHDAPSGVDSIVRALCRLALCVPRSQSLPEHVVQGCVDPALRLVQDNLGALRPSTWRLLIDLLLRTRCGERLCCCLQHCLCVVQAMPVGCLPFCHSAALGRVLQCAIISCDLAHHPLGLGKGLLLLAQTVLSCFMHACLEGRGGGGRLVIMFVPACLGYVAVLVVLVLAPVSCCIRQERWRVGPGSQRPPR